MGYRERARLVTLEERNKHVVLRPQLSACLCYNGLLHSTKCLIHFFWSKEIVIIMSNFLT